MLLALPAAHVLAAFVLLRRWSLAAVSVALGMPRLAALWESQAWPWWQLAALYAAMAIPLFGALTPVRRYGAPTPAGAETYLAVQALSWLPLTAAVATAAVALDSRVGGAPTVIEAASTVEYRTLVFTVLAFAPLIAFEAWSFRRWEPAVSRCWSCLAASRRFGRSSTGRRGPLPPRTQSQGAGGFIALTRWRRVAADSAAVAVQALSWLPVGAGILAARIALGVRLGDAAIEAPATAEYRALVLIVLLLAPLITFEAWRFRRWEPGVAALLILLACVAALWPVFDWPTWTLAAAYAVAGAGGFVGLTRWRRDADDAPALAVKALSWLPSARASSPPSSPSTPASGRGDRGSGTAEYRTLVLVVLLLAPLITFEAWRFRRWEPGVAALLILLPAWPHSGRSSTGPRGPLPPPTQSQARAASLRLPAGAASLATQPRLPCRRSHGCPSPPASSPPSSPSTPASGTRVSRRPAPPSTARWCWSCCCSRRSSRSRRGASAVGSRAWPRC